MFCSSCAHHELMSYKGLTNDCYYKVLPLFLLGKTTIMRFNECMIFICFFQQFWGTAMHD